MQDEQGQTLLHRAASREVVNALINRGADINARDEQRRTPLHRAAAKGYTEVVNALIDRGCAPLHLAVIAGHEGVTEVLIQRTLIQDFIAQKPDYLIDKFSTYWDKCKNKIEGKIGNSNTSYLDLLKADEDKIVIYLVNDKFKKKMDELNYEGEFSALESQIRNKFNKGVERRKLIDDGTRVIQRFDCDSNIKLNSEVRK